MTAATGVTVATVIAFYFIESPALDTILPTKGLWVDKTAPAILIPIPNHASELAG